MPSCASLAHSSGRRRSQQLPGGHWTAGCWAWGYQWGHQLDCCNLDVPASVGLALLHNRLHKLLGRRRTLAHAAAMQVLALQTCQRGNWRLVQGKHSSALAFWVQPAGALTWRTFHLLCGRRLCRVRMNIYTCGAHNACLICITGCDMHSWQRRQRRDGTCAANRTTHARILARLLHRCPQSHRCPLLNSSHSPLAQPSQKPLPGWLSFSRTLSSTAGWCPWAARSATDCSAAGMARQAWHCSACA